MITTTTPLFRAKTIVNDRCQLHIIDIETYTPELITYLNKHFVNICEGVSGSDLNTVKKRVATFFQSKDETTKMGAMAEFFIHLYLKYHGYKQECTFLNLEEGSIKKGFDGYYSKNEVEWIMESKSGSIRSENISHSSKISEGYRDLVSKFNGDVSNNPWRNAYNHASHIDVGTHKNIRQNIKKLSDNFTNKLYPSINEFNIIPASTIFLNGQWINLDTDEISSKIMRATARFKYKDIVIICVTKSSINLFLEFLDS